MVNDHHPGFTPFAYKQSRAPRQTCCSILRRGSSVYAYQQCILEVILSGTYWENHDYFGRTFDDHSQIEPDFQALERFMDHNVLDARGWDEGSCRAHKVVRGRSRGLNPEPLEDEQRLLCADMSILSCFCDLGRPYQCSLFSSTER